MEKVWRFLATFPLTAWMFPYRCKGCGKSLQKLHLNDLPAGVRWEHIQAGTGWMIEAFGYRCPDQCGGPDRGCVVM